jgi:hypothetical protein
MRNVTRALPAVVATELVALYSAGNWAQLVTAATRSAALVVGELLKAQKFSLQANNKTNDRGDHPGRDAQFSHINQSVTAALAARGSRRFRSTRRKRDSLDFKKRRSGMASARRSGIDASTLALPPAQGKETENRSRATNQKDSYQSCANGAALPMTPQT